MIVRIRSEAEEELEHAFDYYEAQRRGLGHDFLDEYVRGTRRIAESPGTWVLEPGATGIRRYRIDPYPYSIIYQVRDADCMIVAIAHLKRRPGYWRNRLE